MKAMFCKFKLQMWGHLRDLLIVIVIGNVVSYLFNAQFDNFWVRFLGNSLYSLFIGGFLWKGNQFIGWYVGQIIDQQREPYKALWVGLTAMFFYSLLAILFVNYVWFVLIYGYSTEQLFKYSYATMLIEFVITIVITAIFYSIGFFQAWREAAVNEERLQKESIRLQYKALRNQVNPHFLFNSLNTLTTLVYEDADLSARFIKQLSEVYRYVLEHKDAELVQLETELEFCRKYAYLQKIRHGESLNVEIPAKGTSNRFVVPMSVQMLLENAIKHNEVSEENPLNVLVKENDEYVEVTNNLQLRKAIHEPGSGIGLETLKKRYDFLSDKKLEVIEVEKEYKVIVPILKTQVS